MPIFNRFRINEELLGRVMASKKNDDLVFVSDGDKRLIKKLYNESTEQNKTFKHKAYELLIGKKLVKYTSNKGQVRYKLFNPKDEYIPELKIERTVTRPVDFKNNISRWIWYIRASNKRMEMERIKAEEAEKNELTFV
jgi:hypothetical protein